MSAVDGSLREMSFAVVHLILTDPLQNQPWLQDRRNQTKPNQTGTTFGEIKAGKADRRSRQESSQQRTSSPSSGRDTEETKNIVKVWVCASPEAQRVSHVSMGSSTFVTVGYFEYHCYMGGCLPVMGAPREMLFAVYISN